MPSDADLRDLQPSQLYVSRRKIEIVEREMAKRPGEPMEPLPVLRLGPHLVLTDGHTRALAAHRAGRRTVRIIRDTDELDLQAYRICVEWCLEAGIRSVPDLVGRIISEPDYEVLWLQRCREMHERLALSPPDSAEW